MANISVNKSGMSPLTAETTSLSQNDILSFYWNYFELHSNQRMQMINFFITIQAAVIGAFVLLLQQESRIVWAEALLSVWITLISITFFGLDLRTRKLIHNCENLIKKIEHRTGGELSVFTTSELLPGETYTFWLKIQYAATGLFGIISFILVIVGVI